MFYFMINIILILFLISRVVINLNLEIKNNKVVLLFLFINFFFYFYLISKLNNYIIISDYFSVLNVIILNYLLFLLFKYFFLKLYYCYISDTKVFFFSLFLLNFLQKYMLFFYLFRFFLFFIFFFFHSYIFYNFYIFFLLNFIFFLLNFVADFIILAANKKKTLLTISGIIKIKEYNKFLILGFSEYNFVDCNRKLSTNFFNLNKTIILTQGIDFIKTS